MPERSHCIRCKRDARMVMIDDPIVEPRSPTLQRELVAWWEKNKARTRQATGAVKDGVGQTDLYVICGACIQDLRGLDALDGQEPHTGRNLASDVAAWIWE